jgi:hypothetical protein
MNCSCEVRKEAGLKADGESRLLVGATRRVAPTEIRKKFGLIGDQVLLFQISQLVPADRVAAGDAGAEVGRAVPVG